MTPVIIAIDPGLSGGIAWVKDGKAEAVPMPDTPAGIRDVLDKARTYIDPLNDGSGQAWHGYYECICYIEKVNAMPRQGVSSTWTFAEHYGTLKAALICLGIPQKDITPAKWQKTIGATRPSVPKDAPPKQKEAAKREGKHRIKEIVEARFPTLQVTLKTADALGILLYAIEKERTNG